MSVKKEEAAEHLKLAEKLLKTTFLRWKPDYDSAADELMQAAQCYRISRDLKRAKDCNMRAAECYKKSGTTFHAAKAIELAIMAGREFLPPDELCQMAEHAANLYQQYGSIDSAAFLLDKTARILEERSPNLAVKLFQLAAEICSGESSKNNGSEYINKASRILVKLNRYDEAAESIEKELNIKQKGDNNGFAGRLTVCLVLVHLARGDLVAATKAFHKYGAKCEQTEVDNIKMMLKAFDEHDRELARGALNTPFIRHMDVEYACLARRIPLPEENLEAVPEMKAAAARAEATQDVAGALTADDGAKKDNEEGGLC